MIFGLRRRRSRQPCIVVRQPQVLGDETETKPLELIVPQRRGREQAFKRPLGKDRCGNAAAASVSTPTKNARGQSRLFRDMTAASSNRQTPDAVLAHLHRHPPTIRTVDETFQITKTQTEESYAFDDALNSGGGHTDTRSTCTKHTRRQTRHGGHLQCSSRRRRLIDNSTLPRLEKL